MKRYLLLAIFCLAALSCEQETNFYLTPEVSTIVLGPEGGSLDEMIFTNGTWTCTVSDDAVTVTPASGDYTCPVHIEVGENQEMFTKAIRIRFTSSYDELYRYANVVVTQACHPFIFCEEPVKSIGPEGGDVRFSVNASEDWQWDSSLAGGVSQVDVSPVSGGANRTDVTVRVPANDTGAGRSFTVRLVLKNTPATFQNLTVNQL